MKHKLLFALIMGLITTGIISFALIAINIGLTERFVITWLRSWSVAYVLAVSAMLFIAPKIQLLVNYLLQKDLVTKKAANQSLNK
jgi:hypothetical protein